MSALTNKQRNLIQREEIILNAAKSMLRQHGYNYLTMDRIAEEVKYSKGTIYSHFASKEDIICSLYCNSVSNLIKVFERAYNYHGNTREKFLAIGISYLLYYQHHQMYEKHTLAFKSSVTGKKINRDKLEAIKSLEYKITKIPQHIVQVAIEAGDLDKKYQQHVNTIVFGFWAMHYGALLQNQPDSSLHDFDSNPVVKMLWKNTNIFLDGYQWQPVSSTTNSTALFQKITAALLEDEI